jgi:hypothetical protein
MDIYVIEEGEMNQESELAPTVYRTFGEVKTYITAKAREKGWTFINESDEPEPDFEENNNNRYTEGRARPAERPLGKTYIWARPDHGEVRIIVHKLELVGAGGRRKTARTIRMKKGEYLREHHHLFRVLRNPTRRALNAELRRQQKELRERGLK